MLVQLLTLASPDPLGIRASAERVCRAHLDRPFVVEDTMRSIALEVILEVVGLPGQASDEPSDERATPRSVEVRRNELATGLEARDHRRTRRDGIEVVDGELDAKLARDGEQVQNPVGRAPGRGY